MPQCKCGTTIQSGRLCQQCSLAQRFETDVDERKTQTSDLERCTDCSEVIDVEPMETCPHCGSWGRLPVDDQPQPESEVAD